MKMLFTFKISDSTLNLFSLLLFIYTFPVLSETNNSILIQGQQVKDGQTIISPSQNFSLGFFSLGNSTSRYVGIWYNRIPVPTFVWVANRNNPISDRSGVLSIGPDGNLMVSDGNNTVWSSTNSSLAPVGSNVTGIMSDTGKFIVSTGADIGDDTKVLWQTSDHPTDTFLPNVRLYLNTHTGETHPFLSWKSENDPSAGNFSMGIDPRASPQVVVWEGLKRKWRSGHWNRYEFTGIPNVRARFKYGFDVTLEDDGDMYITFTTGTSPRLMRFTIQWHGQVQQLIWDESRSIWNVTFSLPSNPCEDYNRCGNFGICSVRGSSPVCDCIQGFVPKFVDQWNRGNWSGGCTRRTPLQCSGNSTETDGFLKLDHVKMPDFADLLTNMDPRSCEDACAGNCSCSAYNYLDGIGCLLWSGDLVDVEGFQTGGEVLYVHLANSELGGKGRKVSNTATIAISVTGTIVLGVFLWLTWRWRAKLKGCSNRWMKTSKQSSIFEANNSQGMSAGIAGGDDVCNEGKQLDGPPLPLLSFSSIEVATDKFADKNKLGQGGFGPVHWGILPGGQEIAVKRLSKWSGQGLQEFKNEMVLIAKLQHRNLVRLLGYCIEGEEKMLVYEYMRNKSLDTFLFDPSKKAGLDWGKRFMIIEGIARGLLYLHRDSRLRIIHRDLKVSNILLDEDMNPKISDFGMARIFGGNQNEANTNRVVGTFGYMSPEYAMDGLFSVKSDVYTFGVLLLEIISGQRNTSFRSPNCMNLIQHAWNLWMDEKTEELIDPSIADPSITKKALQCIHVAMLCVQQNAANRPTMAAVVLMLESQNASFPKPRPPDIESMDSVEMDSTMESYDITVSSNDVTVKEVTGR